MLEAVHLPGRGSPRPGPRPRPRRRPTFVYGGGTYWPGYGYDTDRGLDVEVVTLPFPWRVLTVGGWKYGGTMVQALSKVPRGERGTNLQHWDGEAWRDV